MTYKRYVEQALIAICQMLQQHSIDVLQATERQAISAFHEYVHLYPGTPVAEYAPVFECSFRQQLPLLWLAFQGLFWHDEV